MRKLMVFMLVVLAVAHPADAQVLSPPRKPPVVKQPVAKKPVAKRPAVKKPVAKRPAVKKPVAKKPAVVPAAGAKPGASSTVATKSDSSASAAQKSGTTPGAPPNRTPVAASTESWRPYGFAVFSSEVVDSNIEREKENPVASNGFVVGAVARYQSAETRPALSAAYEIARHKYSRSDQFDRVSHNLSAVASRRFSRKLTGEAIAEAGFKGSSEDRDVGNQYFLMPRLNYRLDAARRLRLYGAYRMRRYEVNADRDAENRYAGTELRSDVGAEARMELGFRYETNSARAARRSYVRRTYHAEYTRTFGDDDNFAAKLKYRSQRYDKRPVSEDSDNPRHDRRLNPAVEWIHRFGRGLSMIAFYEFENRTSNDPDNGYRDHVLALTGRFDW